MYKSIIITLFVFAGLPALAQNRHDADSLRKALNKANSDTARVNTYLRLAEFEIFKPGEFKKDLDSAEVYLGQAKKVGAGLHSPEITGRIALAESHLVKEQGHQQQGKALVEKAIKLLSNGTDKYLLGQAYLSLAEYCDNNNPAGLRLELSILPLSANAFKSNGNIEREAYVNKMIGDLDTTADAALKHLNYSLKLYQSIHYKKLQAVYAAIGAVYLIGGDYKSATDYQLKALKTAQDNRDTTMQLCEINNHIGITYFKLKEFAQAVNYFRAALHTAETYKDVPTMYLLITNICNSEIRLKHPQEIINILNRILNRYPTPRDDINNDMQFTKNYILAYTMLRQYSRAETYSNHLVDLINHNQFGKSDVSDACAALITYYFATKQYAKDIIYLRKNDTVTRQLGLVSNIAANHTNWYYLNIAQNDYKSAVNRLLILAHINDSINKATKTKEIAQLRIQYDTKAKEDQINILNQKTALDKSNLNRANLLKNVTMGGIVLVLIIAGLLYRQSRLRQRNNKTITTQNKLITQKNELLQSLVTEKEWLLKEVHHRVKNNLHSVISLLEAQAAYLENDALQAIENSQHRIYAMSLIHQKLYQSDDIKTIDMAQYMPELVQYLRDSFNTGHIRFNLVIDQIQLNASQAIPLGLIINEGLTNSLKYAFPDNRNGEITISLSDIDGKYKLEMADNGIGMKEKSFGNSKSSLGLELMRGLAKEIGGNITFKCANGVRIIIVFQRDILHVMDQLQQDHLSLV